MFEERGRTNPSELESYTLTCQLIYILLILVCMYAGPYVKIPNKANVKNLHHSDRMSLTVAYLIS
jgi:hypothetical protein